MYIEEKSSAKYMMFLGIFVVTLCVAIYLSIFETAVVLTSTAFIWDKIQYVYSSIIYGVFITVFASLIILFAVCLSDYSRRHKIYTSYFKFDMREYPFRQTIWLINITAFLGALSYSRNILDIIIGTFGLSIATYLTAFFLFLLDNLLLDYLGSNVYTYFYNRLFKFRLQKVLKDYDLPYPKALYQFNCFQDNTFNSEYVEFNRKFTYVYSKLYHLGLFRYKDLNIENVKTKYVENNFDYDLNLIISSVNSKLTDSRYPIMFITYPDKINALCKNFYKSFYDWNFEKPKIKVKEEDLLDKSTKDKISDFETKLKAGEI